MIVLKNASPYRASHTLAETRSPYGGIKSRSNIKGAGAASVDRSRNTLKHVPLVEYLDWSKCTVKKIDELEPGDRFLIGETVYKYVSHFFRRPGTKGVYLNVITVLENSIEKKIKTDAHLDNEFIVLLGDYNV